MKTVGIIGCGAIGTIISRAIQNGIVECDELILYDHKKEKVRKLKNELNFPLRVAENLEELISFKPKIIVEAASQQAVKDYLDKILAAKIELIVMSVGALLELGVKSQRVHIPSGAIGGLDAISSAELAGIQEVMLTTRKNPDAFGTSISGEKLVYEGTAEEAVHLFPREMNVAATLALTTKLRKLLVKVIADPEVERNVHEIRVKWKLGEMLLKFSNDPHPENPKTSSLAAWSAIKLLKEVLEELSREN